MLMITPIFGNVTDDPQKCAPGTGIPPCACAKDNYMPMQATSGQVSSANKFQFKYGKTRMRARMSQGYYTWTAFWLHPANANATWPRDGETDVMESVGKWPNWFSAVAHYEQLDGKKKAKARNYDTKFDFGEDYHVFGLDWDNTTLRWTVDENEMFKVLLFQKRQGGANRESGVIRKLKRN
jgi:beta-glucanase (GH16 family)